MSQHTTIYLASGSPRRQEILTQLGVDFIQIANHFDETQLAGESAKEYVERVARGKALSAMESSEYAEKLPVLGADTTVVHQGQPLGKPDDLQHAEQLLERLSGQTHHVYSSVVITHGEQLWQTTVKTEVTFSNLSKTIIQNYCRTKEPMGKAGAYAIQGLGGSLITTINGSYTNVVGLPLYETRQLLEQASIKHALV
ncbi:nucleoside triphosphate pyrophosphatase YhdE [Kangiella japonica]|uniref:dTTP/UTP pyrophosphatase n=1 Tax=Kangiella japonica TaxID=647384 RepID=A0ABP3CE55_9GAMM